MLVKSEGIVLQNIKYADKKVILKVFTKDQGLLTFYAVTGKAPSSKVKVASVLPLSIIELSFPLKQNKDVQQLYEANLIYVPDQIGRNYNKLAIAQFLNEVLVKSIKEHLPNEELFEFITGTFKALNESEEGFANMHVSFLIELTKYLGFEPHNNFSSQNIYFDTREGKFTPFAVSYPMGLSKEQSQLLTKVLASDSLHLSLNRNERNDILESLLAIYKMHVAGFNDLRSFAVLKELFA